MNGAGGPRPGDFQVRTTVPDRGDDLTGGRTRIGLPLMSAVAVLSAAALGYEILLTRLFSIVQWHHFAFLVISVALLGFGASGTFLLVVGDRIRTGIEPFLSLCALGFGLAAPVSFVIAERVPFNVLDAPWSPGSLGWLLVIEVVLTIPFFFAATGIGRALMVSGNRLSRVYAADLAGAGIGAAASVGVLYLVPAERALDFVCGLGAVAGALAVGGSGQRARRRPLLALCGVVIVLAGLGVTGELRISPFKPPAPGAQDHRRGARRDPLRTARPGERGREPPGAVAQRAGTEPPGSCSRPGAGGAVRRRGRSAPDRASRCVVAAARIPGGRHFRAALSAGGAPARAGARRRRRGRGAAGARRRGALGRCGGAPAGCGGHGARALSGVLGRCIRTSVSERSHRRSARVRRSVRRRIRPHPGHRPRVRHRRAPGARGAEAADRRVGAGDALPVVRRRCRRLHRPGAAPPARRGAPARDGARRDAGRVDRLPRRPRRVDQELEHQHAGGRPIAAVPFPGGGGPIVRARPGVRSDSRPGNRIGRRQPLQRARPPVLPRSGEATAGRRGARRSCAATSSMSARPPTTAPTSPASSGGRTPQKSSASAARAGSGCSTPAIWPCPPRWSRRSRRAPRSSSCRCSPFAEDAAERGAGRHSPASSASVSPSC